MARTATAALTSGHEPSAEELRARVAARFRSLAATTSELRAEVSDRVRDVTDLKGQARRHPLWMLGLAGGAGLAATSLLGRTRRGRSARLAAPLAGLLVRFAARWLALRARERASERRWRPASRY